MKNFKKTLTALALLITLSANAQFKAGILGGLNLAQITGDVKGVDNLIGYHAGLMAEIKLPIKIGVELDALYSVKGAELNLANQTLTYVDFPLVLKIYTVKIVSFQIGPQYSYLLAADYDDADIKNSMSLSDFSAVIGLGLDVTKLHAAIRYNIGVTNILKTGQAKNSMFQFSLGYWFN